MANLLTHTYAEIIKFQKNEDGTATAYGIATDSSLDSDKQRCDANWLKTAMPEWFKYGNIREQHSSIAAGVGTELEEKDGTYYIKADIVDAGSVSKLEKKVFKGFSVGIRDARVVKDASAPNGLIIGGEIVEISLVDRPANPNARLMLAKSVEGEVVKVEEEATEEELKLEEEVIEDAPPAEPETPSELVDAPTDEVVVVAEVVEEPKAEDLIPEETPEEKEILDGILDATSIEAIIERAVKSATESVRSQLETLQAANEAGKEELNKALTELATANNKAASGGPKRTANGSAKVETNDLVLKAIQYRNKAASTTDPILAKGWKEIAQDFEAKALEADLIK
jgi:hypothetical protein